MILLIVVVMVAGCPVKYEGFKDTKKKASANLSKEESTIVEMLQNDSSDSEIKEYMTKNINKFKNKETFANIMDALADDDEVSDDEDDKPKKSKSK
jgi:uncharacterized membrane-anchored protein YjiN (DUF445 family)